MVDVPDGSIYFWMYSQGLRQVPIEDIEMACLSMRKEIREKDYDNYWRGYYKSELYLTDNWNSIFRFHHWLDSNSSAVFLDNPYSKYPEHPYGTNVQDRWVPCNKDNKPMIKWGNGCMSLADAVAYPNQMYLAENLKGSKRIVIDCDGDHGEQLDVETMSFLHRYKSMTHCIEKPGRIFMGMPVSFHLTFKVDRIIPTMHFPYAHVDIIGNRRNSLRYLKNKEWNGLLPAKMTEEVWKELQGYIGSRKERHSA